jgi:molecular chaperone HscB
MSRAPLRLDSDDFELFGLPRQFAQGAELIDRRRRELLAEVHPDRFASAGGAAQRLASQWASRVNEAHRRLKDPIQRAMQLCLLGGVPVDTERNTAMPAAFLTEQMQWHEALDEAQDDASLNALAIEVKAAEQKRLAQLQDLLDAQGDLAAAAQAIRALLFVRSIAEHIAQKQRAVAEQRQ